MMVIGNTVVAEELITTRFCCDLPACKGACCVEGDAGAPLEEEEVSLLEDHLDEIKPFMSPGGIREALHYGVFDYDAAGKIVTPLVEGKECIFVFFENGIARCAIEKAFLERRIPFGKPVSCHLYPIRITRGMNDQLKYHRWHICAEALEKGKKEKLPLYVFLRNALIQKYGEPWYLELVRVCRLQHGSGRARPF